MTFLRTHARLAALVLGGLFIASCDSRLPTSPGSGNGGDPSDLTPPVITFKLSAGTNNTVDLGSALSVTVTATDNIGVQMLNTTLNNGATVIGADTSTLKPTQPTTSRTITVPMSGRKDGDKIVIRSTASDASLNFRTDSIIVTIADTTAPKMTMTSKAISNSPNMKGGDSLDVTVTASDSSGIKLVGYRVYHLGGPDSLTVVMGDSVAGAANSTTASGAFKRLLATSMNIGTYRVVGFATDNSGRTTNPGPTLSFTIVDGEPPTITFVAPAPGATLNVGDQLFVRVNLHDNVGLKTVKFYAVSPRGDIALGTADTVVRYDSVAAPQGGATFRTGLTDTLDIKRYLSPRQPVDTLTGKLLVYGVVTDMAGNVTRDTVAITMTKGPNVTLLAPVQGDSITRGTKLRISVSATSGVGVTKLGFDVKSGTSGPAWPTPVVATYDTTISPANKAAGPYVVDIDIPADAPSKGVLTIAPHATDINGQPGMPTPQDFLVRVGAAPPPLVRQSISPRIELKDSVTVYASGAALTQVGYVIRDVLNPNSRVDSGAVTASSSSFGPKGISFILPTKWQGKRVSISAFARDSAGNVGWAVPAGVSTPITDTTKMARDTTLIVYGRTYALPANRNGVASDISVDGTNGNVFISNTQYNRLERWTSGATPGFDPSGVAVGSQPWGMAIQNDGDTLLVANSGGTNISKVCINPAVCGGVAEVLSARLQTRSTYVFTVTESRDATTGKIRLALDGPFTYSDRPQYVQQSAGGRVFYSTRPTATAPAGTIRWLDPTKRVPDPRQIWQYATPSGDATKYAIFNSDSILIIPAPANSPKSDQLLIFDHVYGDTVGGSCNGVPNVLCNSTDSVVTSAAAKVVAQGGDVEAVNNLDVASLKLTDTTFVASSGDRTWVGFGEGNTGGGTGRIMMVNDPGGASPGYFSPNVTVRDILNNASESVFGLGLDLHGANVVVHGQETYFAALETPFHLRLQGTYNSFSTGAGVAFHPSADLRNGYFTSSSTDSTRTAFVASSNGSIEVVDAKYFVTRGSLVIKNNLYGALRASLPFPSDNQGLTPSDPNYVVLKLFGLTPKGLVVIDLRASDIQPVP